MDTWTALRRWHLQLKVMITQDMSQMQQTVDNQFVTSTCLLQAMEKTLAREQRCYDVVYRAGARVLDARESLLDENAPADVREVLSFSTRSGEGFICRVTCLHDGHLVLFSASEYVEGLQTELDRLLSKGMSIDKVVSFIWTAHETWQTTVD